MKEIHETDNAKIDYGILKPNEGKMITYSGKFINLHSPLKTAADQIDIIDIAVGLSNKAHFSGQTPKFFSVAEHCLIVSKRILNERNKDFNAIFGNYFSNTSSIPNEMFNNPKVREFIKETFLLALVGLLHDSAEAYVGDLITPLKIILPEFKKIEDELTSKIFEVFELDISLKRKIKQIDIDVLNLEYIEFYTLSSNDNVEIRYLTPIEAKNEFLNTFYKLKNAYKNELDEKNE